MLPPRQPDVGCLRPPFTAFVPRVYRAPGRRRTTGCGLRYLPAHMDPFLEAAGPAPARHPDQRWRQVALLGVSAAAYGAPRAHSGLAAALLAVDCPGEGGRVAVAAGPDDAWARWWRVLAVGQGTGADGLDAALESARREPTAAGPDGREVARRLDDLAAELDELSGGSEAGARFALLGHRARPERRVLLVGRSSAAFLVDPEWERFRLVRLAPSDGPSAGNRAHLPLRDVIAAVRRGEAGAGRDVPGDEPTALEPGSMLEALREDPENRDRRLIDLANEVRAERERLAGERAVLEEERAAVQAERQRLRRVRPVPPPPPRPAPARLPRTPAQAAAVLGIPEGAAPDEVERSYREQVVRCHPDRVAGLHPDIQERAAHLTVSLNAARDLLLDRAPRRRRAT